MLLKNKIRPLAHVILVRKRMKSVTIHRGQIKVNTSFDREKLESLCIKAAYLNIIIS